MKFYFKKIYIILLLIILFQPKVFAKDDQFLYTRENISNYFQGVVSVRNHDNYETYKRFKKLHLLKNRHSSYNVEFLRTLVLLGKFNEAFTFSEEIWDEKKLFFEADLLLGLTLFKNKKYEESEKYFKRLNAISKYNLYFDDFFGNVLLAWSKAAQGKKKESFSILEKIPQSYRHLTKTQKGFLKCFFDTEDTEAFYHEIITNEDYNFSRYNFFLVNYLLFKNKEKDAAKIIKNIRKNNISNLLIQETETFLENKKKEKVKDFFNCKNPNDDLAEFFYVIANLYSTEQEYRLSNFYLKISDFLNNKFLSNKALLAENFYYQEQYKLSKVTYGKLKSIGPAYSWYASKIISTILLKEENKEIAVKNLENAFNLIPNPNFEYYYEMANFYKDNEYYEKSIKHYSIALEKLNKDHFLIHKILDRRGTSYERMGDWERAEKDLIESLKIKPHQANVMNYLAYSWVDKGINLDKALKMLIDANEIKKGDGYIIDSLGWAYYAKKDYVKAKKFLQQAVELLPNDPIINDHYADNLWMLNKNIQARYFWNNVLKSDEAEEELKDKVNQKLILGITNKL